MMGCCGKAWGKARAFWSYQQQHHQRQPSEFKAKQTDSEQLHPDSSLLPLPSPLSLNKYEIPSRLRRRLAQQEQYTHFPRPAQLTR
jgi:hypothetical protein